MSEALPGASAMLGSNERFGFHSVGRHSRPRALDLPMQAGRPRSQGVSVGFGSYEAFGSDGAGRMPALPAVSARLVLAKYVGSYISLAIAF